jgi:uncharacterized protein
MNLRRRSFVLSIKSLEKDGSFAGYGSVFHNADYYRDVVMPGAFQKSLADWKTKGKLPPVLWQHQSYSPIGPHTAMREDNKGLYTEGQLLVDDVQQARECYALLKSNVISGQSIGYDVPDGGEEYDGKTNVNRLNEIDLWECSIVTFPANEEATVTEVKKIFQHGELPTLRQFEGFLRDAGFSRKQSTEIAVGGIARLLQRDAGCKKSGDAEVSAALDSTLAKIESFKF